MGFYSKEKKIRSRERESSMPPKLFEKPKSSHFPCPVQMAGGMKFSFHVHLGDVKLYESPMDNLS